MTEVRRLHFERIAEFDQTNPYKNAELTQEMCDVINKRFPRNEIYAGTAVVSVIANVPVSAGSESKQKYIDSIKEAFNQVKDQNFKKITLDKKLELDVVFFLASDYERRDLDNMLKPFLDALKGVLFEDDGQIIKIVAEKHKVKEMMADVDKKFYEQIYFAITTVN